LNVGSLFSGIGGLDLGLERAGMRVLWQVECDPYARAVLARRFPGATLYADVREVGASKPCSRGSRLRRVPLPGHLGCRTAQRALTSRSGLWSEFARIVRELRPSYVLVENVPALLVGGMERVVGDLAACGYDAEWDCFPAAPSVPLTSVIAFSWLPTPSAAGGGYNQSDSPNAAVRPSLEMMARRALWPTPTRGVPQNGHALAGSNADGCGGSRLPDAAGARSSRRVLSGQAEGRESFGRPERSGWWDAEPDVGRVAHGVPARVDRLRCLGNAVVPQVAEWIGRRILAHAEGR
jgi:DNA (cytosine-5)-methyltransferase 1